MFSWTGGMAQKTRELSLKADNFNFLRETLTWQKERTQSSGLEAASVWASGGEYQTERIYTSPRSEKSTKEVKRYPNGAETKMCDLKSERSLSCTVYRCAEGTQKLLTESKPHLQDEPEAHTSSRCSSGFHEALIPLVDRPAVLRKRNPFYPLCD